MLSPIILFQFPQAGNIPNLSPFCMKLETYFRMANIPYKITTSTNPKNAPHRKLPYIQYGNELIGDSTLIIARLEADSENPLNHHLNAQQRAEGLCVQRMLEDHFYWTIVYSRWCSKAGWPAWSARLKKKINPLLSKAILHWLKSRAKNQVKAQGIGRFDDETVLNLGLDDLSALDIKIGDREWYFNDKPSTYDAIIYSFLGSCLSFSWPSSMKEYILSHENMKKYVNQIHARYFPELKPM